MTGITVQEMAIRLVLAMVMGGIIGFEREYKNRPAGLRTHILVALGSALIMLISMYGFDGTDQARLAAQVVSGIGFLGAGTILRDGTGVRGLTTAASIWVTGGIGLALGNGFYEGAILTTFLVVFSLIILGLIENLGFIVKYHKFHIHCKDKVGMIGEIGAVFGKHNMLIKNVRMKTHINEEELDVTIAVRLDINHSIQALMEDLRMVEGVISVNCNNAKIHSVKGLDI